jgi:hypothetical protein
MWLSGVSMFHEVANVFLLDMHFGILTTLLIFSVIFSTIACQMDLMRRTTIWTLKDVIIQHTATFVERIDFTS